MTDTETAIEDRELPRPVAERFRRAFGMDDAPATFGVWADATARTLDRAGFTLDVDAMCLTEESPHKIHVDGDQYHVRCVLDTLLVPFLFETLTVEVCTRSPVSGTDVEVTVTHEDILVVPDSAVMSFGIAADTPPLSERGGPLAAGPELFCPYIVAFADEREYERWDETADAVTTPLTLSEGYGLAGLLADRLPR